MNNMKRVHFLKTNTSLPLQRCFVQYLQLTTWLYNWHATGVRIYHQSTSVLTSNYCIWLFNDTHNCVGKVSSAGKPRLRDCNLSSTSMPARFRCRFDYVQLSSDVTSPRCLPASTIQITSNFTWLQKTNKHVANYTIFIKLNYFQLFFRDITKCIVYIKHSLYIPSWWKLCIHPKERVLRLIDTWYGDMHETHTWKSRGAEGNQISLYCQFKIGSLSVKQTYIPFFPFSLGFCIQFLRVPLTATADLYGDGVLRSIQPSEMKGSKYMKI
jgi:hypothetical protein